MTKMEFLNKLQEALSNDLNPLIVQENINYYKQYIEDEVRKGRSEEEVIAELGDPWALAKTIADSEEIKKKNSNTYTNYNYSETYAGNSESPKQSQGNWNRLGSGIKIFIVFLLVIVAIVAIVSIIGGIFSALLPVIVPILLVVLVVRLFAGRR
ncbi:MAG TPA: DUF1700 domain-containing protein [Candidatus Dorea intestinavium]|nr:DUF1700 domain-containing protein [Candidatus Dorea intestinavium]